MPRVSVLMAHHGTADFLQAALNGISEQTFTDVELIIVDDGAGIDWDRYVARLKVPVSILENETRRGLAFSLNRAAEAARGEYFARHDSDDRSSVDRLGRQLDHLDRHPRMALVGSAFRWIDERNRVLGRSYPLTESPDLRLALFAFNQFCHGSVLMRRSAFERVGGYDVECPVAQDYELWMKLSAEGFELSNLPEPLYDLRLHERATSHEKRRQQNEIAARMRGRYRPTEPQMELERWLASGRMEMLGRPYERLQRAKLALFLAAGPWNIRSPHLGAFLARAFPGLLQVAVEEVGWRYGLRAKLANLFGTDRENKIRSEGSR